MTARNLVEIWNGDGRCMWLICEGNACGLKWNDSQVMMMNACAKLVE